MNRLWSREVFCIFGLQLALLWTSGVNSLRLPPSVRRPPSITNHPPEVYYALPEAKTILPCTADAMPAVQGPGRYYWKKDGKLLNVSEQEEGNESLKFVMNGRDGSLYFNGSEILDSSKLLPHAGKYQCFATNEWGTALSRETDLRIGTMAPFVAPANENLEVMEGDSRLVSCHENVTEDVEIKWTFDPETFQFSNRIAQASDGTIVFSNVEKEDNDLVFFCSLKYLSTRSSTDGIYYTLSVKPEETMEDRTPTIVRPQENKEIRVALKGNDIKLTCIATGKPTPSVYWEKKGMSLGDGDDEDRFQILDYNRTLHITNVKYTDAGEYTCTVANDMGMRRRDVVVVVEAKPYFPDDTKRPMDMIKVPGERATIHCELDGVPEPDIIWMRNGMPINDDERGIMSNGRIVLWSLTIEDTAVYQCVGTNKHGTVMGQGFLNVLISPPIPFPDNRLSYRLMEGNSVDFICEMFASPSHHSNWTKFGQPWKNLLWDERITLKDVQTLEFNNINLDDNGTYECKGTNEHGSASINISLLVLEKTRVVPTGLKSVYFVPKGKGVNMSVAVHTAGDLSWWKTTWYKDGYEMGTGMALNLLSVKSGAAGNYTVIVETEFDQADTLIRLIVQNVPDPPTSLTFTKDEDDPFAGTLNWEPPGDNHSPITGYIIESEASGIYRGKWVPHAVTPDGIETRSTVTTLEPWVKYRFRVWAENAIGRSENASSATDVYETPPEAPRVNPVGVGGEGTSPNNMVISWDPVDPIEFAGLGFGYDVSWCLESNCTWESTFCDFNVSSYTVTATPPYTRYLVKVVSSNDIGDGPEAQEIIGYSGEDVPLEPPSEVTHHVGNDSKVILAWKPVPEEKMRGLPIGYVIQANETNTDKVVRKIVGPNDIMAEVELEPFTEYEIMVAVSNSAGTSDSSTTIKIKTPEGLPDAPESFTLAKRTLKEMKFDWEEPSKVKGIIISYRLKYKWMEGSETKSEERSTTKRKIRMTGLTPSTVYNLTLCAETSRGYGNDCARLTASTIEPKKPREAKYDVITDQTLANVSWERSEEDRNEGIPVRSYRIEHRIAETEESEEEEWMIAEPIQTIPGEWSYNITVGNLSPGTMYEFRLVAKNEYGETFSNSSMYKTSAALFQKADTGIVGQPWFIVVLCIAALIVLIVVIVCFMRRREGGKYSVSEKEEQLVKLESQPVNNYESGKYSVNSNNEDLKDENGPIASKEETDRPNRLRGDSVGGNSIEAFGSGDTREYEEDGSFIDQYGVDPRSHNKSDGVSSPGSEESKDVTNAQTRLLSHTDHAPQ